MGLLLSFIILNKSIDASLGLKAVIDVCYHGRLYEF